MRIYLKLSPSQGLVPYNYQQKLVGAFHKWLGWNDLHDKLSLYSLSWLSGGIGKREGLYFNQGATWFISSPQRTVLRQLTDGIFAEPEVAFGMRVEEIVMKVTPKFGSQERFILSTPVLIKRQVGENTVHYDYTDPAVEALLSETLQAKLQEHGLSEEARVRFDRAYARPKCKVVEYRGIKNKANFCPVIVEGSPEAVAFAWEVGVGNSTGIGFGALK